MLFSAALTKLGRDSIYMNKPIVDFDIKLTEIPEPASISESESSNEIIEVTSDDDYSSSSQQSMRTKLPKDNQNVFQRKTTHTRRPKGLFDQVSQKQQSSPSTTSPPHFTTKSILNPSTNSKTIPSTPSQVPSTYSSLPLVSKQPSNLLTIHTTSPHPPQTSSNYTVFPHFPPQQINRRMRDIRTGFNPHSRSYPTKDLFLILPQSMF
ncbi:hypothetical protein BLNAU_25160 [Blattamonas nauphoetae]|uniref:Uncharacterized protein n=1 Tax=Blattamonas nauphoetae TaxID=2049346 RepID=A0ABQ9WKD7_9EUKA|nr:hypothetical protein BLNAU_25160 [Blattamonas nauphoetae]